MPVPRRKIPDVRQIDGRCEFHMFADSNKDVAAAAVYLRVIYGEQTYVHLIAARTSLHSKSEMTKESMPRKEIIALDLGVCLLKECLGATSLTVDDYELWSDSQTVIQWCRTKTLELRVFERNRVDLILKNSNGKLPRYIPSGQNPADVATQPCRVEDAECWSLWLNGPEFLQHPHFPWPENCVKHSVADQNATVSTSTASTINKPFNDKQQFMQYTLNCTNKLAEVLRVVLNVLQCFTKWKRNTFNLTTGSPQHNDADDPEAGHPDATDLTQDFSPGNSDAIDILTLGLGLGLGLGRVLGLELGRQDVPGLKNTEMNFLASGRSRQDVADPMIFMLQNLFLFAVPKLIVLVQSYPK